MKHPKTLRHFQRLLTPLIVLVSLVSSVILGSGSALAVAVPTATLNVPTDGFVGESFSFTVTFDNTSGTPTDTGYGPYIDLILPKTGADGAGAQVDDGITFVDATYLGQTVTATVIEFDGSGNATHPYAVDSNGDPLIITGTPGDDLVVLLLPFGSFTQGQPAADITVNVNLSNLADVGTPLNISASAGFQFGADPLDNPSTDPSITGTTATTTFTPTLFTLTKTYIGPEDETATGPNFPRQYLITVDIADGQTLTNLDLIDVLPDNLQFVQVDATTIRGTATATTAVATPSTTNPGGTLTRRFASVTGTTADNDATMLFTFYVPRDDLGGDRVIVPLTGDDVESINDARTAGNWDPIDTRDPDGPVESDVTTNDHTLTDKSIAIQKGVANVGDVAPTGNTPGDTLEYTLDFQISDFFAFESIVITDTFSDGQRWDTTFEPELSVNGNTWTLAAADFDNANYTVDTSQIGNDTDLATDGSTTVYFRVSDEMITRGQDGKLIGGCIDPTTTGAVADCSVSNDGPTTATLTFRTIIQDEYSDTYPSGNPSLNENDALSNSVLIDGLLLSETNTAVLNGTNEADDSAAGINIAQGTLQKTVYAVNGDTGADPTKIAPGDEVTYRLRYDLVFGDFELLSLTDFVPLPVFFVGDPDFDGTGGPAWSFDATGAITPPTGQWKRGPADTQFSRSTTVLGTGIVPTTTIDIPANSVRFDYGTFDDPGNVPTTIDLLFTITASNEPFADRLFLTNQVRQSDQNTQNEITTRDAIVQIELTQPVIAKITKGVIATNNSTAATFSPPNVGPVAFTATGSAGVRWTGTITSTGLITSPVNSDLSGVDADDLVSFAIVIENIGTGLNGAFDVQIRDTIPTGFSIPSGGAGLNLTVTDGTGAAIAYTNVGAGSGLFDLGIELTDPGPTAVPTGALDPYSPDSGRNIAVITYDLQVDGNIAPSAELINTATLFNYAGEEGAPDHTPNDPINDPTDDLSDDATVTVKAPVVDKTINGTNQEHTTGNDVAIGEILTYTVAITVPEGLSANAQLIDTLDNGLVFVDCLDITASAALATTVVGGYPTICSAVAVSNQGRTATFDFGDITNSNRDNAVDEVITLTYRVVVINGGSNDRGDTRNNSASWEWDSSTASDSAPNVTIVEPTLSVDKTASPTTGDAGDEITYTLVVNHAASSNADTFNVVLSDTIPVSLTYVGGSLSVTGGTNPTTGPTITGALIEATWDEFPQGTTTTIEFRATLNVEVQPGEVINNRVDVTYTSLPGDVTAPQTPNSSVSTERTGDPSDPGGNVNDYVATDTAPVTVNNVDLAKSIVATSESDTADTGEPDVTIGEIVRYRLTTSIPEGTSPDFQIQDYLPEGLTFLNDGTAQAALVSNGGDKLTLDPSLTCDSGTLERDATDPTNVSLDCVLPDTAVSSSSNPNTNNDVYNTGTDVYFRFGELTNSDTDNNNTEYVIIEFNALVDNTSQGSNDAGESRNNYYRVLIDGTQNGPGSNGIMVNIVEPFVDINKDLLTVPSDADDVVTYTVTFTNTQPTVGDTSVAYNLLFTDTLPSDLTLDLNSIVVTATSSHVNNSADNSVLLTFEELPVGGVVEVTYSAKLKFDVMPGQQVDNTAQVTYTSLPGTGTTGNPTGSDTPGGTGDSDGERDGSGGINDYSDNDPASFNVALPQLTKIIVATSENHTANADVAIGEIVRYRLTATLPEGTSNAVNLVDTLPTGYTLLDQDEVRVSFVADNDFTEAGDLSGADNDAIPPTFVLPSNRISINGQDVTFDLGTLINNDSDAGAESIVIEFNALVQNVAANNDGDTKTNSFKLTINGVDRGDPATVDTDIVEPSITNVDKAVTLIPADADDPVIYTVTYSNTGSTTAFEVRLLDVLPTGVTLQTPVTVTLGGGATGITDNSSSGANTVDVTIGSVPVNGTVSVAYAATVEDGVSPQQTITNTADIVYTSLPNGGTPANPTGSETPGGSGDNNGERDGSGGVNDYSDSDPASFTAADPGVVKQLDGTSAAHTADPDVTIGEVITYALTVTLPEGLTPSLVITDDLPTGLSYVVGSVAVDSSGFNGTLPTPSITATGGSGDDVIVTFGNISVTADNVTTNNSFIVRLQALVLDEVGNVGLPPSQTDLINNAAIRVGNNPEITTNPVTVTVVEPQMVITKTLTPAQAAANDTLTIELVVQNTGESTAFDVIIDDPLPTITFTNISEVSTPAGFSFSTVAASPNTIVRYTGGDIPVGEQRIFTFTAQLTTAVNAGDVYTNVATVTQATTLPGTDPNERDEPDVDAQDDVTVIAPDLTLTKDDGITVLEPGQTTIYTLTVENVGSSEARGVVITDTVPAGTTFDAAASSVGWSCADNAAAGSVCTYTVGTLAVAADVDVFFAVTVDLPLAASVTSIVNVAFVADDGSQGDDPTPSNNTDDDTDQVIVGALGDYVWEDADFDGLQGNTENGIDGVTVNLLNSNGDVITSTVTSGGGLYNFGGLGAGGYIVEFVPPNGYLFTQKDAGAEADDSDADTSTGRTDIISLGQGETNNDIDAGLYQAASLGDFVWDDLNADGIQDPGEPGIPGVEITLSNGLTTTTDANGIYTFTNLVPGVYTVTVDVPAGYVVSPQDSGADDTVDSDIDTNGVSSAVTLVSGENNPTLDAGLYQLASLGDFVWDDLNADGIQDPGEPGIPGVEITLSNGLTTTTDANGIYTFTNLAPGVYTVTVDVPAGYVVSPQDSGADDTVDSDIDTNGVSSAVTLVSGENNPTLDAGLYQLASLGDFVWDDLNADGIQDPGEPGIPGVEITLSNGLTTTTDANGIYTFTNLVPGTYTVTVDVPAGYVVSPQDSGADDTADSDIDTNGVSDSVTLQSGDNNITVDAGVYQPASLGDRVWEDLNADGIQDPGEPGIPGVEITLSNGLTTTTDANGIYTFTNLAPGTYTVVFTPPAGYIFTDADQGSDDTADSDANPVTGQAQTVTLAAGENNPTIDAGLYQLVNIGDTVWFDYNGDGLDTADEPGIGGVTVNLLDSLGNVISTTVTLADGTYLFPNLPPGTYTVTVDVSTLPPGLDNTYDLDGGNDSTATAIVPSGQDNLNFDFGYNAPPVIVATKTDVRIGDNDANGLTSPGDTLRYTVVITNVGFSPATNVVFNDTPDENTTLVSGSVTASQGAVTVGNGAGDQSVSVAVGTLAPSAPVTITFDVQIAAVLPAGVNQVANQGFVTSSELPDEPTDDPETPDPKDPTITVVVGTPRVVISKQIVGATQVKLGDALTYTIRITNTGNTVLTTLPLTDTFTTDYLDFVSAVPAPDVVDEIAGFAHWADLTVAFGNLLPGDSFTVTTVMRASGVTPEGVTASNRATVANVSDEFDQAPSDEVVEGLAEIDISPYLILTKSRIGSEVVEVGQEITYSIRITNTGDTVIVTLPLSDSYDSQVLNFVRSQPAPTQMRPGLVEWADLTTQFGDLVPSASIEVLTVFTASQAISNAVNMAMVVNAVDEVGNLINAEDSATVTVASPTAVTLLSFTATPQGDTMRVAWVTGAEVNSWGFHLWRSQSEQRAEAVRITQELIPAIGSAAQGASYLFIDSGLMSSGVTPGANVHYWLEEIETDNSRLEYGPIHAKWTSNPGEIQVTPMLYLPWITAP